MPTGVAMKTKPMLELDDIKRIASAAEAEALAQGWAVTIAITDDGGHLLWLQRLDGAAPISAHIAPAKAHAAALGQRETKVYEDMINQGRTSFLSVLREVSSWPSWVPSIRTGRASRSISGAALAAVVEASS